MYSHAGLSPPAWCVDNRVVASLFVQTNGQRLKEVESLMVLVNTFSTYTAKPWLGLLVTPYDRCTM